MEYNQKSKFEIAAEEIGKLVTQKNKAYGDSFEQAGEFLKLLFPNGIPVESYTDMLCIVRIFDKLKRIATHKDAYNESPYFDLTGYGILGYVKDMKNRNEVPHAKSSKKVIEDLKAMSKEQVRQTFINAGIIDDNGNLMPQYTNNVVPTIKDLDADYTGENENE